MLRTKADHVSASDGSIPTRSNCPVCDSTKSVLYLEGEDSLKLESVGSSRQKLSHGRILRCEDCGTCFRSLRPRPDQLAALYRDADDRVYEAEGLNRKKTADRHIRIAARYFHRPGAVLDVGSASGAFLRSMVDAGWRGYGVEPSATQCARARQLLGNDAVVEETTLESAGLTDTFDLVTLWDVLEHVSSPAEFLACCSERLRPGGYLILNTPRIDSFAARVLGKRWPLLLAEHLTYFTPAAIRLCAKRAGLEVVRTGSRPVTFSLGYILYRLSQHELPLIRSVERLASILGLQALSVPVWMGEILAVCKKAN